MTLVSGIIRVLCVVVVVSLEAVTVLILGMTTLGRTLLNSVCSRLVPVTLSMWHLRVIRRVGVLVQELVVYIYVLSSTSLTAILPFSLLELRNRIWAGRPLSGALRV